MSSITDNLKMLYDKNDIGKSLLNAIELKGVIFGFNSMYLKQHKISTSEKDLLEIIEAFAELNIEILKDFKKEKEE